jgi:hypothetical protein
MTGMHHKPLRPRVRPLRRPVAGLSAVIVLGLLAAFFAWQAAEPFWLALGRGEPGTATVTRCAAIAEDPSSPTYRCVGFEAASGAFHAVDVELRGAGDAARTEGAQVPALMLSAGRGQAYALTGAALHLRWALGLALVLACGAGIAWASGATRLDGTRPRLRSPRRRCHRRRLRADATSRRLTAPTLQHPRRRWLRLTAPTRWAVLLCFAGPLLLAAGFLAASY